MTEQKREGLLDDGKGELLGTFSSQLEAMDACEAHRQALRRATGTDEFGQELNDAEGLANFVLAQRGLPTEFPMGSPTVRQIGSHSIIDWWGTVPSEQKARLEVDESLEAQEAVSLKFSCHSLRAEMVNVDEDQRAKYHLLITFGRRIERLVQHKLHGARIDAKRRSDSAIAARARSDQCKATIRALFAELRHMCSSDAEAYQKIAAQLTHLDLTEHAVRHIVRPSTRKSRR